MVELIVGRGMKISSWKKDEDFPDRAPFKEEEKFWLVISEPQVEDVLDTCVCVCVGGCLKPEETLTWMKKACAKVA